MCLMHCGDEIYKSKVCSCIAWLHCAEKNREVNYCKQLKAHLTSKYIFNPNSDLFPNLTKLCCDCCVALLKGVSD